MNKPRLIFVKRRFILPLPLPSGQKKIVILFVLRLLLMLSVTFRREPRLVKRVVRRRLPALLFVSRPKSRRRGRLTQNLPRRRRLSGGSCVAGQRTPVIGRKINIAAPGPLILRSFTFPLIHLTRRLIFSHPKGRCWSIQW